MPRNNKREAQTKLMNTMDCNNAMLGNNQMGIGNVSPNTKTFRCADVPDADVMAPMGPMVENMDSHVYSEIQILDNISSSKGVKFASTDGRF